MARKRYDLEINAIENFKQVEADAKSADAAITKMGGNKVAIEVDFEEGDPKKLAAFAQHMINANADPTVTMQINFDLQNAQIKQFQKDLKKRLDLEGLFKEQGKFSTGGLSDYVNKRSKEILDAISSGEDLKKYLAEYKELYDIVESFYKEANANIIAPNFDVLSKSFEKLAEDYTPKTNFFDQLQAKIADTQKWIENLQDSTRRLGEALNIDVSFTERDYKRYVTLQKALNDIDIQPFEKQETLEKEVEQALKLANIYDKLVEQAIKYEDAAEESGDNTQATKDKISLLYALAAAYRKAYKESNVSAEAEKRINEINGGFTPIFDKGSYGDVEKKTREFRQSVREVLENVDDETKDMLSSIKGSLDLETALSGFLGGNFQKNFSKYSFLDYYKSEVEATEEDVRRLTETFKQLQREAEINKAIDIYKVDDASSIKSPKQKGEFMRGLNGKYEKVTAAIAELEAQEPSDEINEKITMFKGIRQKIVQAFNNSFPKSISEIDDYTKREGWLKKNIGDEIEKWDLNNRSIVESILKETLGSEDYWQRVTNFDDAMDSFGLNATDLLKRGGFKLTDIKTDVKSSFDAVVASIMAENDALDKNTEKQKENADAHQQNASEQKTEAEKESAESAQASSEASKEAGESAKAEAEANKEAADSAEQKANAEKEAADATKERSEAEREANSQTGNQDNSGLNETRQLLETISNTLTGIHQSLGSVDEESGLNNLVSSLKEVNNLLTEISGKDFNLNFFQAETSKNIDIALDKEINNIYQRYSDAYDKIIEAGKKYGMDPTGVFATIYGNDTKRTGYDSISEFFDRFNKASLKELDPKEYITRIQEFLTYVKAAMNEESGDIYDDFKQMRLPTTNTIEINKRFEKVIQNEQTQQANDALNKMASNAKEATATPEVDNSGVINANAEALEKEASAFEHIALVGDLAASAKRAVNDANDGLGAVANTAAEGLNAEADAMERIANIGDKAASAREKVAEANKHVSDTETKAEAKAGSDDGNLVINIDAGGSKAKSSGGYNSRSWDKAYSSVRKQVESMITDEISYGVAIQNMPNLESRLENIKRGDFRALDELVEDLSWLQTNIADARALHDLRAKAKKEAEKEAEQQRKIREKERAEEEKLAAKMNEDYNNEFLDASKQRGKANSGYDAYVKSLTDQYNNKIGGLSKSTDGLFNLITGDEDSAQRFISDLDEIREKLQNLKANPNIFNDAEIESVKKDITELTNRVKQFQSEQKLAESFVSDMEKAAESRQLDQDRIEKQYAKPYSQMVESAASLSDKIYSDANMAHLQSEVDDLVRDLLSIEMNPDAFSAAQSRLDKLKSDVEEVVKLEGSARSLQANAGKLGGMFDGVEMRTKAQGVEFTPDAYEKLQKARNILLEIQSIDLTEGLSTKQIEKYNKALENVKKIYAEVNTQASKLATEDQLNKLIKRAQKVSNASTGQLKTDSDELVKRLQNSAEALKGFATGKDINFEDLVSKLGLKEMINDVTELEAALEKLGKQTKIGEAITNQSAQFLATYFSMQDMVRYGKQIAQTVISTNSALTELRKVSDASNERIQQSFETSAKTAQELGSTITDVINSTSSWARLGYSVDEAEELAKASTMFQVVGDNMTQETASESMISTLKGFQMEASDAMDIVDKFNEVNVCLVA